MHPAIALVYEFLGIRTPAIDREWLNALMETANTPDGLRLASEPAEAAPAAGATLVADVV